MDDEVLDVALEHMPKPIANLESKADIVKKDEAKRKGKNELIRRH